MKKEKSIFWIRFSIYTIFAIVIPVLFLIWKFKLFQKISSISVGGWGVIAILIVAISFISMLRYIKKGMTFSFITQCINGIVKIIIPLVAILLVINAMKESVNELIQFLVVYISCQVVAIPVNPFPKWIHDNKLEEEENKFRKIAESIGIVKPKQ